jgi:N-methylhydantoinase B
MSSGPQVRLALDPVSLEIMWHRLIAIADEAATTLVRTSFSPIVRESNDFSCVVFDAQGHAIAENTIGIPSFNMTISRTLRHFLDRRPAGDWLDGDVALTNDPWLATGHLPDITLVQPVFLRGALLGWVGSVAHQADIGGAPWSADAVEVYEEGLRIPPMLIAREGVLSQDLLDLLRANVRLPEEVVGDVLAQMAAGDVAARRLVELVDEAELGDLAMASRQMRTGAEAAMRAAVDAIPDGSYTAELDLDGTDEEPIHLEVRVTINGTEAAIDYTGTSPYVRKGINCPFTYTEAYSCYPVKCAIDPDSPRNEGSYACVTVSAPRDSILNPPFPAAVNARHLVGHCLAGVIFQALAPVIPDRVIAESGAAPTLRAVFHGSRADGSRFSKIMFISGGMGAGHDHDGLSATCFPSNVVCGSMESVEAAAPLRVWRKQLAQDSGGPGEFRGGLGQDVEIELLGSRECTLALFVERISHPARGLLGGQSGSTARVELNAGATPLLLKGRNRMRPGDRLGIRYAGGGGFGDPALRSEAAVHRDVVAGLVSESVAASLGAAGG